MTGRERFGDILCGRSDRSGFWHGHPHADSLPALCRHLGVRDDLGISRALGDTLAWVMPEEWGCWKHPEGKPMFDVTGGRVKKSLGEGGVFAECCDVAEAERFPWPDVKYLDFTLATAAVREREAEGLAVLSGMWCPFFHVVADFFGMDNYFVKMYTDPDVVLAVTGHVVDFYLQANEIFLGANAANMDAFFFGNDLGSQLDLLISPDMFARFVLPYMSKLIAQAKRHGLRVVLHSCGSIDRAIPSLIDAGVDALHPIQALARNMDAENLARKYKDKIVFIGGVDTQHLLPFGTPQEVREEVRRLRALFGENYIASPSHEALLPNVPPENLLAMAEAAR